MSDCYKVTVEVNRELYAQWQRHIREEYGIQSAGRYAAIMEKNSEVFGAAIVALLKNKKSYGS